MNVNNIVSKKVDQALKLAHTEKQKHQLVGWVLQSAEALGLIKWWITIATHQFMYITKENRSIFISI